MKAMILAAGFGTRLRPLTNHTPKPLLPIGGKPLMEWNLLLLRQFGITEVIINLHHLGAQIQSAFGNGSALGMRLRYSHEAVILGTGGGLKQAEPFFLGQPFLVLNGDTLLELDLGALMAFHKQLGGVATMVVREDPEADRWGLVEVDQDWRVVRVNGRGRSDSRSLETYMFAGVHVMDPRLLKGIPVGQESSIIDAYQRSLAAGELVGGFLMEGYWSDVGTLARYEQAQRDVELELVRLRQRGMFPSA